MGFHTGLILQLRKKMKKMAFKKFKIINQKRNNQNKYDKGNLENLIQKVDKVGEFWETDKADRDLSRYFSNILPVTRQAQIAGELPRKA